MPIKTYPVDIASELQTEEEIAMFIEEAIAEAENDTDPKYLIHAFETAARARGMLKTAKDAGLDRSGLYRALSGQTDPRASTLAKVANAFGYRLTFAKQNVSVSS